MTHAQKRAFQQAQQNDGGRQPLALEGIRGTGLFDNPDYPLGQVPAGRSHGHVRDTVMA